MNRPTFSQRGSLARLFFGPGGVRTGWRLCIFLTLFVGLLKLSKLLIHVLLPRADRHLQFVVGGVATFLILLLATWILGRMEGRRIGDFGLPWRDAFRVRFWQGALLGCAFITCLLIMLRLTRTFYFGAIALHGAEVYKWAVAYALVFLLVALVEEFGTRGYVLFTLSKTMGFWPAAVLLSALFAGAHAGNPGENWIGLMNLGFFGLITSMFVRVTGNLWMSIGFHTACDWCETFSYGVANSGGVYPGQLLDSKSCGPSWLSGGSAGPEGSVIYTGLMVASLIWCGLAACRQRQEAQLKFAKDLIGNLQGPEKANNR